jgi:hypothetical protein
MAIAPPYSTIVCCLTTNWSCGLAQRVVTPGYCPVTLKYEGVITEWAIAARSAPPPSIIKDTFPLGSCLNLVQASGRNPSPFVPQVTGQPFWADSFGIVSVGLCPLVGTTGNNCKKSLPPKGVDTSYCPFL